MGKGSGCGNGSRARLGRITRRAQRHRSLFTSRTPRSATFRGGACRDAASHPQPGEEMMKLSTRTRNIAGNPDWQRAALVAVLLLSPLIAHAQATGGTGDVGSMLTNVVTYLTGNVLTALATLAVVIVGISMMALRFSLMTIGLVIGGIAIAFSASTIVTTIHG
jgi:type IV secretory pathway VirB2 component (pilin)